VISQAQLIRGVLRKMVDGGREVFDGMTENLVPVIKLSAYLQTPTHPFSKDRDTRFQKIEILVFTGPRHPFSKV
jgi:hypothetical protein